MAAMESNSRCFLNSAREFTAGHITEEEHLSNLLAHFRGVRHPADNDHHPTLHLHSPVAASMKQASLREHVAVHDIDPYLRLFRNCVDDNLVNTTSIIEKLESHGHPTLIQQLAVFAAEHDKTDMIKYCLEKGALADDPFFSHAALKACETSNAMLDLLWSLDWRKIRSIPAQLNNLLGWSYSYDHTTMMFWLLDHGAMVTKFALESVVGTPTTPEKLSVFIREGGIVMFKDSGALQYYAEQGRTDLVETLLNAGAEIDEIPTSKDVREPGPFSALYEATKARKADVVQLLLDRGADIHLKSGQLTRLEDDEWIDASPWELAQRLRDGGAIADMYKAKMEADAKDQL